jgi:hypothetical protein
MEAVGILPVPKPLYSLAPAATRRVLVASPAAVIAATTGQPLCSKTTDTLRTLCLRPLDYGVIKVDHNLTRCGSRCQMRSQRLSFIRATPAWTV